MRLDRPSQNKPGSLRSCDHVDHTRILFVKIHQGSGLHGLIAIKDLFYFWCFLYVFVMEYSCIVPFAGRWVTEITGFEAKTSPIDQSPEVRLESPRCRVVGRLSRLCRKFEMKNPKPKWSLTNSASWPTCGLLLPVCSLGSAHHAVGSLEEVCPSTTIATNPSGTTTPSGVAVDRACLWLGALIQTRCCKLLLDLPPMSVWRYLATCAQPFMTHGNSPSIHIAGRCSVYLVYILSNHLIRILKILVSVLGSEIFGQIRLFCASCNSRSLPSPILEFPTSGSSFFDFFSLICQARQSSTSILQGSTARGGWISRKSKLLWGSTEHAEVGLFACRGCTWTFLDSCLWIVIAMGDTILPSFPDYFPKHGG